MENLWSRWEQCKTCKRECGWSEPVGIEENEEPIFEHFYECSAREVCDTDLFCDKYEEV